MFDEPAMSSKRSGRSAAMSASVKFESRLGRYMVWCVEMFEWKTARLKGVGMVGRW